MSLKARSPKIAGEAKAWLDRLETVYADDHPNYLGRYDTYVQYVAFLTAGTIEHHWVEGANPDGGPPFVPRGNAEDFLFDLHKRMRAFRQSRHVNGLSSPELLKCAHELISFLVTRVPSDVMDRFLAVSRTYLMQHEAECFA